MAQRCFLAVDLGASGGRVVGGLFDGQKLRLEEVARFPNGPTPVQQSLHWDLLGLWNELRAGLRQATDQYSAIASVGVDTWGVDYGLLGRDDVLLGNPHCYRDPRTEGAMEKAFEAVGREAIFNATGLQFMPINTLYQLYAMRLQNSPLLEMAERFLMIPDLFHWLLTGHKGVERTNASTTQCLNPQTGDWARDLLEKLDIPTKLFGELIEPGTKLDLLPTVADDLNLKNVNVVVPGTHDTASAVVAVPANSVAGEQPNWCYLSAGTWCLMGVETPSPIVTPEVLALNYTNEGGVGGTTRLLKNITGLWLVQECRRIWARDGKDYSWEDLTKMAADAPAFVSLIDPDHADFGSPGDMPAAIAEFCRATGQTVPEQPGEFIRCAIDSIALKARKVFDGLESLIGGKLEVVHIVGGGTQNLLLCQAIADACNRPTLVGPVEATALGNCLMQAISGGDVGSIAEGRALVRESFPLETYEPQNTDGWEEAYGRFQKLLA